MTTGTMWRTGGVRIKSKLYRADKSNNYLEDLSDDIVTGKVDWSADRGPGVKLSGVFTLSRRGAVRHRLDWLAPVLRLTWLDGTVQEQQFGLFLAELPEDEITREQGMSTLRGLDPTWLPWNSTLSDTLNVAAADNCANKVQEILSTGGWARTELEASARTFGTDRSWFPGRRRFEIAASILEGMNWYHPFSDLTGVIRSRPYVDLAFEEPSITIGMDDPVGKVRVVPTTTTLANVIVVRKDNTAEADGIVAIARNDDPSSPTSTVNMTETMREFAAPDIQTQGEADALAAQILQDSGSYYRVLALAVEPGIWMRPWQLADVQLASPEWGDLTGKYHIREWALGFTPNDATVNLELNQISPAEDDLT